MVKAKSEAATQAPTALVYVGPNVSGGGLLMQFATVYKGGALPAPVAARCADDPNFTALFVPVGKLASARADLGRVGSTINRAATAVARAYAGGK